MYGIGLVLYFRPVSEELLSLGYLFFRLCIRGGKPSVKVIINMFSAINAIKLFYNVYQKPF
jgi:hypothetical protein